MIKALARSATVVAGSVLVVAVLLACAIAASVAILALGAQAALLGRQQSLPMRAIERLSRRP